MSAGRGPRVLVIDDEAAARYGIIRALSGQCGEIREAENGAEGVALTREFKPDIVVSDINMPGMDGLAMLSNLRQFEDPPLVILITAYGSENVAIQALRAGAYDYLTKPYELDELRTRVANAAERQRLTAELKQSQAKLLQSRKMAAIAEVASGVAHEINNPLGALQSSLQTIQTAAAKLADEPANREAASVPRHVVLAQTLHQSVDLALQACARISRAVGDLRRFAQLDRADVQRFQVNECVNCVAAVLAREFGADIRLDTALSEVGEIDGNPREINQVIYNLVRNSVEAVRRAERPGRVVIRTAAVAEGVQIEVADDGCGIPERNLPSLFEPGFTTKDGRVEFGLGLPICYSIVESHHGSISVNSRVGEGTTFTVTLPRDERKP